MTSSSAYGPNWKLQNQSCFSVPGICCCWDNNSWIHKWGSTQRILCMWTNFAVEGSTF